MIRLGQKVKDVVSGFTGIATARTEWLNACVRICVQPEIDTKDGKHPDACTFDEEQLKVLEEKPIVLPGMKSIAPTQTGGDRPNASPRPDITKRTNAGR